MQALFERSVLLCVCNINTAISHVFKYSEDASVFHTVVLLMVVSFGVLPSCEFISNFKIWLFALGELGHSCFLFFFSSQVQQRASVC